MRRVSRHINIPIFIPHEGCPHNCIFCNQKKISGHIKAPSLDSIKEIINSHLSTITDNDYCEIAFFGGSFTGLDQAEQEKYLKLVYNFVQQGLVKGIRLSTRPDYINREILELLKKYSVKVIELGIQSFDGDVLKKSGRFYSPDEAEKACILIKKYGFSLGVQTMIGLPGDTIEKSVDTAKRTIEIKPDMVRIYPTLVIRDTELEDIYKKGEYIPLSLDEAVAWCAKLIPMYEAAGITVLRVGLHDAGGLREKNDVVAGPVHSAFGELVYSKIWLDRIEKQLEAYGKTPGRNLIIHVASYDVSRVVGYQRRNLLYLKEHYGFSNIKVIPNTDMDTSLRFEFSDVY